MSLKPEMVDTGMGGLRVDPQALRRHEAEQAANQVASGKLLKHRPSRTVLFTLALLVLPIVVTTLIAILGRR